MNRMIKTSLAALILSASTLPVLASSDAEISAEAQAKISAVLLAMGYTPQEIEAEDDMFEAEATKEGQDYEITLNAEFQIVDVELNDD